MATPNANAQPAVAHRFIGGGGGKKFASSPSFNLTDQGITRSINDEQAQCWHNLPSIARAKQGQNDMFEKIDRNCLVFPMRRATPPIRFWPWNSSPN